MIEIAIRPWMLDNALRLSEEMGTLRNSIRNGAGNLVGFLGEECILEYLPEAERDNTFQYDIIHREHRIEVKTKDRAYIPRPHYSVSLAAYNAVQECDFYFFVSLSLQYQQFRNHPHRHHHRQSLHCR